jgi:type II secretory pathway predicted ATPase ExeA
MRVNLEPLNDVINSVLNREAQIMIVKAPYGFGKSAFREVVSSFLVNYDGAKVKPIVLLQPEFNELQLYREIAGALGVSLDREVTDTRETRQLLTRKLIAESHDKQFLLILDDAHFLHADALFGVKFITDLERNGRKICTALLLCSPEVDELLSQPSIAQVVDRMHLRRELRSFSQRDTFEYVSRAMSYAKLEPLSPDYEFPPTAEGALLEAHRLEPFIPEAVARVFDLTGGVPRQVRQLCSRSMALRAREAEGVPGRDGFRVLGNVVERAWEAMLNREEVRPFQRV